MGRPILPKYLLYSFLPGLMPGVLLGEGRSCFFRNVASVIALYVIFLGVAYRVLPHVKLPAFAFLALPGVVWALADAADAAGVRAEKTRARAVLGGFAVAVMISGWFLMFPFLLKA